MTPQQLVDALEAGTLVIPADYREILQAIATQINAGGGGGSGWAVTGTTTLTGAATVDIDGNTLEFSGGEVGIGGAAVGGVDLSVVGDVVVKNKVNNANALEISSAIDSELSYLSAFNVTDDGNSAIITAATRDDIGYVEIIANFNDAVKSSSILCSANATEGTITLYANDGIKAVDAIQAYADNTAAVAAIGTGKLYYTDVAGEYMVKLSH